MTTTFPLSAPGATLALLLATLALAACGEAKPDQSAGAAPPPPSVGVQTPIERTVTAWEEYTGRLSAVETVDVRPRVSGFLDRVHFVEGALVEAGDLLFTLDPRTFRAELSRLQADRDAAAARVELARSEAERVRSLLGSRAVSAEEVESRQQAVATTEAALGAAEADLEGPPSTSASPACSPR